jgi:hypothetical protein
MKRFQKRRLTLRNTLKLKKYGFPIFFMINVTTAMLIITMIKFM